MAPWPPLRAPMVENDVTFDHTLYSSSSLFYLTTRKTSNKNNGRKTGYSDKTICVETCRS